LVTPHTAPALEDDHSALELCGGERLMLGTAANAVH